MTFPATFQTPQFGFQGFGFGQPAWQELPLPGPEEVAQAGRDIEAEGSGGWFYDLLGGLERLTGAHSIRAALAGNWEGAVANIPVFQAAQMLLPEALEPDFIKLQATTMADIRKAWGEQDVEEGAANFIINLAGDIVTDPLGFLFKPFGLTAKGIQGVKAGSRSTKILADAVAKGERRLFTFASFHNKGDPFALTLPFNLDSRLAHGVDRLRDFVATNRVTGPMATLVSKYHTQLRDPNQRAYLKEAGQVAEERGREIRDTYSRTLRAMAHQHPTLFKSRELHEPLMMFLELGVEKADDMASAKYRIQSGIPLARAQSRTEALLDPTNVTDKASKARTLASELATAVADGNLKAIKKNVDLWQKRYASHALPSSFTEFGSAASDVDDFIRKAGVVPTVPDRNRATLHTIFSEHGITLRENIDIPALHRGRSYGLAAYGENAERKAQAKAYAEAGESVEEQAIAEANRNVEVFFKDLSERDGGEALFEEMKTAAEAGRAWLASIGKTSRMMGFLDGMSEPYLPHVITRNKQIREFTDNQWTKFFKGRKFTTMSLVEANIFMRDNGSRLTGHRPVRLAVTSDQEVPLAKAWAKVWNKKFIRMLKKMGPDGEEAAGFFETNPYAVFSDRLNQEATFATRVEMNSALAGPDSPLIRTRTMLHDAVGNQAALDRGLRGLILHKNSAGKIIKIERDTNALSVGAMMDMETRAQAHVNQLDVREWFAVERELGTKTYYEQIQELDHFTKFFSNKATVHGPVTAAQGYVKVVNGLPRPASIIHDFATQDLDELARRVGESNPFVHNERFIRAQQAIIDGYASEKEELKGVYSLLRSSAKEKRKAGLKLIDETVNSTDKAVGDKGFFRKLHQGELSKQYTEIRSKLSAEQRRYFDAKMAVREAKRKREHLIDQYRALQAEYSEAADEVSKDLLAAAKKKNTAFSERAARELLTSADYRDRLNRYVELKTKGHLALDELQERDPKFLERLLKDNPNQEVAWVDQEVYSTIFSKDAAMDRLNKPSTFIRSLGWFDGATDMWKAWTTMNPLFMASRTRDYLSGMAIQFLSGAPIKHTARALKASWQIGREYRSWINGKPYNGLAVVLDNGKEKFNLEEFFSLANRSGLLDTAFSEDEFLMLGVDKAYEALPSVKDFGKVQGAVQRYAKSMWRPSPDRNALLSDGRTLATFFDNQVKLTGALSRFYGGETMKDAIQASRRAAYDPKNMVRSNFERQVLQRVLPFYTFMKYALNTTYQQMLSRPGTVSWMKKVQENAIKAAGLKPEEWEAFMPEFVQTQLGIPVSKNEDGTVEVRLFGGFIPMAEAGRLVNALQETITDKSPGGSVLDFFGSASNPILKSLVENTFNYSFYTGRELEQEGGEVTEFMGLTIPKRFKNSLLNLRLLNEIDNLGYLHSGDVQALLKKSKDSELEQLFLRSGFSPAGAFKGYQIDVEEQMIRSASGNKLDQNRLKSRLRRAQEKKDLGDEASARNVELIRAELARKLAVEEDLRLASERLGLALTRPKSR